MKLPFRFPPAARAGGRLARRHAARCHLQLWERRVLPSNLAGPPPPGPPDPRGVTGLDASWQFNRSDVPGAEEVSFDDSAWGTVTLPHTWNNLDGQDGGNN